MGLVVSVEQFRRRATGRVLVVAAGKSRAKSVRNAVQAAGYSIGGIAPNVPSALKAMRQEKFDAVIVGDPDLHWEELARSSLGQGISFALLELRGTRTQSGKKLTDAQVMH